jgi:hypothetical protein
MIDDDLQRKRHALTANYAESTRFFFQIYSPIADVAQ